LKKNPKISIVTVVYNDVKNFEETLRRNISQSYENKEILVIDGGSTDGTVQALEKNKSEIHFSVSEKDNGIYDAMNKGIKAATGEWIIFMNAGDWFYNDEVLSTIFSNTNHDEVDFIYGNHEVRYDPEYKRIHVANEPLTVLKRKNVFSHQALFSRTELMKKSLFKAKYSLVADFESFFFHYKKGYNFFNSKMNISSISAGGVSEIRWEVAYKERKEIVFQYESDFMLSLYYSWLKFRLRIGLLAKIFLPERIVKFIRFLKYGISG